MRVKISSGRYLALMLAALVAVPLSISGLWIDRASATDPGHDSTVDFALDNQPGAVSNGFRAVNQQVIPARSSFTVEVWVKPDTLNARWNQILHNGPEDNYQRLDINIGGNTALSDQVQVLYGYGPSGNDYFNLKEAGLRAPIGEWTHLAVSVSHLTSTSIKISLFRNGTLVYEETRTGARFADLYNDFYVGYHPGFTAALGVARETRTFDGQIDQIKVWDAALDVTQISESMHALGTAGVNGAPALRASYDFNEGTASNSVFDRVGSRDLSKAGTNARVDVKQTSYASGGKTVATFPRTYLPGVGGWTVPAGITLTDQLVVGGGGGGGSRHAGGGGAGALLYQPSATLSGVLKVQVGQGGGQSVSGQSSFLGTTELKGGGGGASQFIPAQAGGSGAGTSSAAGSVGPGAGTGLRNAGGEGAGTSDGNYAGGGGGGAQSVGSSAATNLAGSGGSGYVSNISGSLACYAAGGGGGAETSGTAGAAGACTSGQVTATVTSTAGAGSVGSATASRAASNSGSGGGGGGHQTTGNISGAGGLGGSGIVVVAYAPTQDEALDLTASTTNLVNSGFGVPETGSFSVEAWVRSDSNVGRANIFSQRTGTSNGEFNFQAFNGRVFLGLRAANDGVFDTGYDVPLNEWVHLAGTIERSGSSSVSRLYVNGFLQSTSSSISTDFNLTPVFRVGNIYPDNGQAEHWKGDIDQVKVWNGVLDSSEITASMHAHHSVAVSAGKSLRAHWDFNDPNNVGHDSVGTFPLTASGTTPVLVATESTATSNNRTTITFERSYLTAWEGWLAPSTAPTADVLVVGGGGGGGAWVGGGGGGGGVTSQTNRGLTSGSSIPVKVGQGGGGAYFGPTGAPVVLGSNGQQSSFDLSTPLVALGGGVGASWTTQVAGGSTVANGGGGVTVDTFGDGVNFDGGKAFENPQPHQVGGGAGAGGNGFDGTLNASGAGGPGVASSVSGDSTFYGGGGGGSVHGTWRSSTDWNSSVVVDAGAGGSGGGGAGAKVFSNNAPVIGTSGTANTGGGGGGGANYRFSTTNLVSAGGQGGSGVVILSYEGPPPLVAPSTPGTPTATAGDSSATLTWTPSATGTAPITYSVETIPSGGTCVVSGAGSGTTASCTGLTNGVSYEFRVIASNGPSSSASSGTSSAVTPTAPPQPAPPQPAPPQPAPPQPAPPQPVVVPPATEPPVAPKPSHVDLSGDGETLRIETTPEAPADVTKYIIKLTPSGKSCEILSTTTHCDIAGVRRGVEYKVVVIAANSLGQSEPRALGRRVLLSSTGWLQSSGNASFENFSGYSAQAKKAIKRKVNRFVRAQTSAVHFSCTGFAVAPVATEPIIELAIARARVVCEGLQTKALRATFGLQARAHNVATIGANRKVVVRAYSPMSE